MIDFINPDELLELAKELGRDLVKVKGSSDKVKELAAELGVQDYPETKQIVSRVLMILLMWERKVGRDQATKQRLFKVLLRLGHVSVTLRY